MSTEQQENQVCCPIDVALDGQIDPDCWVSSNLVRFGLESRYADPMSLGDAIVIYRNSKNTDISTTGLYTTRELLTYPYKIKEKYEGRVKVGILADATTPDHNAYPHTIFDGFVIITNSAFDLPRPLQAKTSEKFTEADICRVTDDGIVVSIEHAPDQIDSQSFSEQL